jgi:3-hydroxybutyryl-CoA dehydratase
MAEHIGLPQAGEVLPSFDVEVTAERVRAYANASGDHNPIHLDTAFAATTSFGGTIAHGMLLLAYLSRLLTDRFAETWVGSGTLDARFRSPALVGTRITVSGEVRTAEPADGGTRIECVVRCADAADTALVTARQFEAYARQRIARPW